MKYVMLIYQGSTPLPGSDEWDAVSDEEQKRARAPTDDGAERRFLERRLTELGAPAGPA